VNHPTLLQAIRDEPGDDLPRLAYADWLEEHGDAARGEMIRLQVELTRGAPDRARALVLLRRLRELVVAHRREWLGPLVEVARDAVFERGFVEDLRLPARAFLRHGGAILEAHPVTRLALSETRAVITELAACLHLSPVRALSLRGEELGDAEAAALARSPHFGHLRALDLRGNRLTEAGLVTLMAPAIFPRLEELNLAYNRIGDDLGAFLSSPGPPQLRQLDLSGNGIAGPGARRLAGPSWLSRLAELSLAQNEMGEADLERLAASPHLAGVRSLNLSHYRVPEPAARLLRERYGPRVVV
jgi:uncharacterized protein (TIGR02996 family)